MSERREDKNGQFTLPADIVEEAKSDTTRGVKIEVTPEEVVRRMKMADRALNGDSNDAEHDALSDLREWLSDVFEDPDRRVANGKR
jgi:chloramphenicol 3-O-phosphotransferase